MGDLVLVGLESGLPCHRKDLCSRRVPPTITLVGIVKERKQTTQGRDGRTARRHHTGILRRGVWF